MWTHSTEQNGAIAMSRCSKALTWLLHAGGHGLNLYSQGPNCWRYLTIRSCCREDLPAAEPSYMESHEKEREEKGKGEGEKNISAGMVLQRSSSPTM